MVIFFRPVIVVEMGSTFKTVQKLLTMYSNQVHDEVILEGPAESAELAKSIVVECMSKPFHGKNSLDVDLAVDAKCAQSWYAAK